MNKFLKTLADCAIDIIIQGSLILYYFTNNHSFILENIIKFIPIFLFLMVVMHALALFAICAIRYSNEHGDFETLLNSTKEECKKGLLGIITDKSGLKKIYDKITDISLGILLVLTGHPFCLIMFIAIKCIFVLTKNMAKQTLKEMEN